MTVFRRVLLLIAVCAAFAWSEELYLDRWRAVADRLIETPPESYPFNWGEGVQMIGLMKAHERTGEERYADYVEKWARPFLGRDIPELLEKGDPKAGTRPGYCGHWSPGTAILYLYQARRKKEYLDLAAAVNRYILERAERSPEGALGHWTGSHQLWVDTLYMACPLLAGMGKHERKPEYIDDAANQVILYARRLQEEKTGLFYHMWDWQTGERTTDPWARGNGWVIMSLADTLEAMDRKHRSYAALRTISDKLVKGLAAAQNRDGLWHTIMDDPASYPEASATAMVAYGVLKLVRLGVLPRSKTPMARRAWAAVSERYVRDGLVTGTSAGTDPKGGAHYRTRPLGTYTWGTGAYLMAGSEIERLR
jgi:unsaturated rhamnogalacturonyl hydrolase